MKTAQSVQRLAVNESHPRIAVDAGVHRDRSIWKLNQLQVAVRIGSQNHHDIGPRLVSVSLPVFAERYGAMAHITSSNQVSDHIGLDSWPREIV